MTTRCDVGRILAGAVFAALAVGCGGTPTSPSELISLPDGNYTLNISLGTLPPIGGSPTFCMSTPSGPLSMSAALPVGVTRSGDRWTVRMAPASAGPLQMSFTAAATSGAPPALAGTIEGSGRTVDSSVTVTVVTPTTIRGTQPAANTVRGQIDGDVVLESASGSLTCRGVSWTLSPR